MKISSPAIGYIIVLLQLCCCCCCFHFVVQGISNHNDNTNEYHQYENDDDVVEGYDTNMSNDNNDDGNGNSIKMESNEQYDDDTMASFMSSVVDETTLLSLISSVDPVDDESDSNMSTTTLQQKLTLLSISDWNIDNWNNNNKNRRVINTNNGISNLLRSRRKQINLDQLKTFDSILDITSTTKRQTCDVCNEQNVPLLKKFQTTYQTIRKLEENEHEIMNIISTTDMIQHMNESTTALFNEYNQSWNKLMNDETIKEYILDSKQQQERPNKILHMIRLLISKNNNQNAYDNIINLLSNSVNDDAGRKLQGIFGLFTIIYLAVLFVPALIITIPIIFITNFIGNNFYGCNDDTTSSEAVVCLFGFILGPPLLLTIVFIVLTFPIGLLAITLDTILISIIYNNNNNNSMAVSSISSNNTNTDGTNNSMLLLTQLEESLNDIICQLKAIQCTIRNIYIESKSRIAT